MLNEKGLASAMKVAWRGSGYTVAFFGDDLFLHAGSWGVLCKRQKLPRKALGLIAEHIGELPEDEAYTCSKSKGAQSKMLDDEINTADNIRERNAEAKTVAKPTPITLHGYDVWQEQDKLQTILLDPDLIRIIDAEKAPPAHTNNANDERGLYWQDTDAIAIVMPIGRAGTYGAALQRLDGFPWCGEG